MHKLIFLLVALAAAAGAEAATLTVNSTGDNLDSDNFLTLREAVVLIDNGGVANTAASLNRPLTAAEQAQISGPYGVSDKIILPAGIISLTITGVGEVVFPAQPKIGDLDITVNGVTVQGAGAASTIILQTTLDRILDVNVNFDPNFVFTLDGVTIAGGRETNGVAGGGVFTGSSSGAPSLTTIKNCKFVNNQASGSGTSGGGGLAHTGGDLIVTNCVFGGTGVTDRNTSTSSGGAIYFDAYGTVATLTVTNCAFTNNTAGSLAAGGGAIDVAAVNLGTGTCNIGGCTFSGNQAAAGSGGGITVETGSLNVTACNFLYNSAAVAGGAVFSAGQPVTVRYCRLLGNTATTPSNGKVFRANGGAFIANDNWWGADSGPGVNDVSGVSPATWLQLHHVANPNKILVPNATTLTASFLTNSAGTFIPVANLGRLVGLPIAFHNAVRGMLSGAQTTIQSSGTATATFTANAVGAGSAEAVVDNQSTFASITITSGVGLVSINRVQTTPTNLSSVQWTVTFTTPVSGVVGANFSLANAGLAGSPTISSVTAVGGAPATSWTVTASTGSGAGTLGLNMVNAAGVSAGLVNLPFTGQIYTIDTIPPTLGCSTNIVVAANGRCPAIVNYSVSVSDNVALSVATATPPSGSSFGVGTNTVSLGARDTAGNTNFCTFKVAVLPGTAPLLSIVRSGANAVISWTNLFDCYALQSTPVLAGASWTPYSSPLTTNAGKIFVTNNAAFSNRFFRLAF